MSRSHLRAFGIALLALLAFPRAGSANLIDIIWEMSGPQMVGDVLLHCELDLQDGNPRCKFPAEQGQRRGVWRLTLNGSGYFSTGKNSATHHYEWFESGMAAVEPMLEARSCCADNEIFSVYHGVGLSYDFLFGRRFSRFNKVAVKFTPIGVQLNPHLGVAYHLRLYPHGFTADEFGFGPRLSILSRPHELVHGFSVYFTF